MNNKKKIIILAVLVLVVILAIFLIVNSVKKSKLAKEQATEEKYEISREIFSKKYRTMMDEIELKFEEESENHIRGTIKIDGQDGGMFLAVKQSGRWEMVYDGKGAYACSIIDQYNFPPDMIIDCVQN